MAMEIDGPLNEIAFPGVNPLQFINTPNDGVAFIKLKPFGERDRSAEEINAELSAKLAGIQEGFAFSMLPPPIQGLGNGSGYSFFIEDRGNLGYGALPSPVPAFQGAGLQTPGLGHRNTTYKSKVPHLDAPGDADKHTTQ